MNVDIYINLFSIMGLNLNNKLTSLPESIGDCSNLEILYVNSNKLTSLPKSIRSIPDLVLYSSFT